MARYLLSFLLSVSFLISPVGAETLEIHIDADYSINSDAAESIELGVATALSEIGGSVAGYELAIVGNDHRGNVKRSRRNMEGFLANGNAIAMIGGLHSPPYLTHREFINQNELLLLLPWSAAGAITRANVGDENWIFRLSVDDTKTAPFFVNKAVTDGGCQSVGLLMLDTGWGRGGAASLTSALEAVGMKPAILEFFATSITQSNARRIAADFARSGADCAILLANWSNGAEIVLALAERSLDVRVFSHWGIMGGAFAEEVSHEIRTRLDLRVLQTCGLLKEANGSPTLTNALRQTKRGYESLSDVRAPTGFIHGYDLAKLLIAAIEQASVAEGWGQDIASRRRAVRAALQDLREPVGGILRSYNPPFTPYSVDNTDGHEALGIEDLCLAALNAQNDLVHID